MIVHTWTVTVPAADTYACGAVVSRSAVPAAEANAAMVVAAPEMEEVPVVQVSAVALAVIATVPVRIVRPVADIPESTSSPVEFVLRKLPLVKEPLAAGSLVPAVPWTLVRLCAPAKASPTDGDIVPVTAKVNAPVEPVALAAVSVSAPFVPAVQLGVSEVVLLADADPVQYLPVKLNAPETLHAPEVAAVVFTV